MHYFIPSDHPASPGTPAESPATGPGESPANAPGEQPASAAGEQLSNDAGDPVLCLHGAACKYEVVDNATGEPLRDAEGQPLVAGGFDAVDCCVKPGQSVLICGQSGAGKSSLLRALNGLIPHFDPGTITGHIRVANHDPQVAPLHETGRDVAMVFQSPKNQFFAIRTMDELAFGLENTGLAPDVILERIDVLAKQYGIEDYLGREVAGLSGGQQQLVACACAHMDEPAVMLLDEPASNLHPDIIQDLAGHLAAIREAGITMVIAEHRLYYLREFIDIVIYMREDGEPSIMTGQAFFGLSDAERRAMGLRTIRPLPVPDLPTTVLTQGQPSAPASANPGVTLDQVTFRYGATQVLDIPHLDIPRGKVTALIGPNGAGKSTLASAICGLLRTKGTIAINGLPQSPRQRTRASYLVMQDVHRQLFASTVIQELTLNNPSLTSAQAVELLATMGLDHLGTRHPLSLSGGQKQRLVVLAATVANKDVFIFDEPSSGLDVEHLTTIARIMRELAAQDKTVIVISHDHELLEACADEILLLQPLALTATDETSSRAYRSAQDLP